MRLDIWLVDKLTGGFVCNDIGKNFLLHVTFTKFHPKLIHTWGGGFGKDIGWKRIISWSYYGLYRKV